MYTSFLNESPNLPRTCIYTLALCLFAVVSSGCDESTFVEAEMPAPFQELYDQGVDRYLGMFVPTSQEDLGASSGTVHNFNAEAIPGGPLCFTGNEFTMSTRPGTGEELLIFLEGGGFCGPNGCEAIDRTLPGVPNRGIMNTEDPENPVADYNMAYIPYCDGTFFSGDAEADSDGDGVNDRTFRGLHNLSASLDVILATFPAPGKILLAGNSAGGFGTHFALPLVRKIYPDVPIEMINDSGLGIVNPSLSETFTDYWNSDSFFPASCTTCIGADGNLTDFYKYQLAEDDNLRMAFISSKRDEVVVGGGDGAIFEEELLQSMSELDQDYPERFRSLIADGDEHTFIQRRYTFEIAGTTVRQWIGDMVSGSVNWVSLSD